MLVAAFANSPLREGRPTGWRSTRQALWAAIGPGRTLAPPAGRRPARRLGRGTCWTRPVMCVRDDDGALGRCPDGLTFRDWTRAGAPRPPTREDLDYHLTTLFPPVRPRGHLELRMIDAQPGDDGWIVPLAVTDGALRRPGGRRDRLPRGEAARRDGGRRGPRPRNPLWATRPATA